MIKIIEKLMAFGMSFEYEHRGSHGQRIRADQIQLEVEETIEGKINYEDDERSMVGLFDINDGSFTMLARYVEEACVRETATFY